jgi:hypothetical protein
MGLWSLFAFVSAAFAASATAAMVATDCNPASVFKIQSLEVVSLPAPANTSLTMTFDVPSAVTTVTEGSVLYSCTLNGMPVYSETMPLCTQTACPIEPGRHVQASSSESPSVAGTLLCTLKWHSLSNEDLLCVKMKYTPIPKSFRGRKPCISPFQITASYVDFEPALYDLLETNASLSH